MSTHNICFREEIRKILCRYLLWFIDGLCQQRLLNNSSACTDLVSPFMVTEIVTFRYNYYMTFHQSKPWWDCSCSIRLKILAKLIKLMENNRLKCTRDGNVRVLFVRKWVFSYLKQIATRICDIAFFGFHNYNRYRWTKSMQAQVCLRYKSKKIMFVHYFFYFLVYSYPFQFKYNRNKACRRRKKW